MSALPTIAALEIRNPQEWQAHRGGYNPCTEDLRAVAGPYPAKTMRWKPWPGGQRCAFDIIAFKIEDSL